MRPLDNKYPNVTVYVVDSRDGILPTGPVVKELMVCLPGLGNVISSSDLAVVRLSAKDAVKIAMKLLENLNFEDKWL